MKNKIKRQVSVFLAVLFLFSLPAPAYADEKSEAAVETLAAPESVAPAQNFIITNPYAEVDFDTWKAYKTQLHVHTNASDGAVPVRTVVEEHYRLGYDILAVTDHAVLNRGWDIKPVTAPALRLAEYGKTKMARLVPIPEERYSEITNGTDRGGRPMLDVPLGIELNGAAPSKSHVNGFFVGYGSGYIGVNKDYKAPVKAVHKLGGYSFINHIADTTGSKSDPSINNDPKVINKYASLFLNYYPSCFAMDINSLSDGGRRTDEVLYDNVLEKLIPYGITPWLVSFSDAHFMGEWDRGFTIHMMSESLEAANKENALEDLKRSMRDGTYFGIYTTPPEEGEPAPYPMVRDIIVRGNTIIIVPENEEHVTEAVWVTNGTKNINEGCYTIDVADFAEDIKSFVRVYLRGPGGICYVQPFTVIPEGAELEKEKISAPFDLSVFLRWYVSLLDVFLFRKNVVVFLLRRYALGVY